MKRALLFVMVALFLAAPGCKARSPYQKYSYDFLDCFDTVITIMGYAKSEKEFETWAKKAESRFQELNKLYDTYNNYAGINNIKTINDNAGKAPVKVSKDIINLIAFSRQWHDRTPGVVNIAMGSVLKIWHDYRERGLADPANAKLPPMEALRAAAAHTDLGKVVVDEAQSTVYLTDPELSLDVGSIAKGYATELVAGELQAAGWQSFILDSGGNVRTVGRPLDGVRQRWGIGVTDPNHPNLNNTSNQDLLDTVFTTDSSVVTSGDYQRYYTVAGKNYNHIIDPSTLMPAANFRAVTVVTHDSGEADYLSTTLFILPYDKGLELVKSLDNVQALWVFADGTMKATDGMKAMLQKMGGASSK